MKKIVFFVLLISVLAINIFIRLSTAFLPDTERLARNIVYSQLSTDAVRAVNEKYKDLPEESKQRAIGNLINLWKKESPLYISERIKAKRQELKSNWQDDKGHTFLLECDPYHWLRLGMNLDKNGKLVDKFINGKYYDSFMLAPAGMEAKCSLHKNLHVYLNYYTYKFLQLFNKAIDLTQVFFYNPVFFMSISLIVVFLFCFSITGEVVNIAGFFASMALGFAPVFIQRSMAGWSDTDPYVVLFSLLIVWFFYLSIKKEASSKKSLIFCILGGLCVGLFAFTWDGWWYIFYLIVLSGIYYSFNLYIISKSEKEKVDFKRPLKIITLFALVSLLAILVIAGRDEFKDLYSEPVRVLFAKGYLQSQFWPNTFLTVQELGMGDINVIGRDIGGVSILFLGLIGIFILLVNKKSQDYRKKQFMAFMLFFWTLIIIYVSIKATRFSLLLIIPVSIGFGLFMQMIYESFGRLVKRITSNVIPTVALLAAFLIFALFFVFNFDNILRYRKTAPFINRSWWVVLNQIKDKTEPGAIINSWWDYGHWFKAIAQRPVIFDGATQNTPMAYWIGRAFSTDSEEEAFGILRMLNSGSNKAFDALEKIGFDKFKCLDILNNIILLNRNDAGEFLKKYIKNGSKINELLDYTHNPRPAYFIVEPSLAYKIWAISFLGGWDFKKADIYKKFKELKKKEFLDYLANQYRYKAYEAAGLYDTLVLLNTQDALDWISQKYKYYNESSLDRREANQLFFSNGFIVDLSNYSVHFNDYNQGVWSIPKSIFYFEKDSLKEITFANSNMDSSVLLLKQGDDKYRLMLLDGKIAKSVFTRLYFLKGMGLKYFKPFISRTIKAPSEYIIVYKIDWNQNK